MIKLLYFIIFATLSCGCFYPQDEIVVMSYNVQNLFDDIKNGTEYSEFDPSTGAWNSKDFHAKLRNISKVIRAANPDIILLAEVENLNCIKVLIEYYLTGSGYAYYNCENQINMPINSAYISRIVVESLSMHNIYIDEDPQRNILDITFNHKGKMFSILFNHWKSKIGGTEKTEKIRIEQAKLLNQICETKTHHTIICGDFNENNNEAELINYTYPTALLNINSIQYYDKHDTINSFIFCSKVEQLTDKIFYNTWNGEEEKGSYYYKDSFERIDHFFLSNHFFKEVPLFSSFEVFIVDNLTAKNDLPYRFFKNNANGVSDHFPLLLKIKF